MEYTLPLLDIVPREILSLIIAIVVEDRSNWFNILVTCKSFSREARRWIDPSYYHNKCLQFASRDGKIRAVKELLNYSRVNPADCDNSALRWACRNVRIASLYRA